MSDEQEDKVLVGQAFRLEDRGGRKYAELKLNKDGLPVLVFYDKAEKKRLIIGIVQSESEQIATVYLCDTNEEGQAGLLVMPNGEQEFFGFAEMVERNIARDKQGDLENSPVSKE